jgi:hypothetical protein
VTGALLALALAAAPLRQEAWAPPDEGEEGERVAHLRLAAWGGDAFETGGSGGTHGTVGGEAAWSFRSLDLGLAGYGYRHLSPARDWTPVGLVRLTERFEMRSGVEAAFGLGAGAAKPDGWQGWFQVSLGIRLPLGPVFLAGELAFERDLLALRAGIGLAL